MRWLLLLLCGLTLLLSPGGSFAWGEPHIAITEAALERLAPWEREVFKDELGPLASYYCMLPDLVQNPALLKAPGDAQFAMMESQPGKIYLLKLHLPAAEQTENLATIHYFIGKAVDALVRGKVGDAARFMGTLCHLLEDFGSPAHTIPGDNMFTLLQEFMPPPEEMQDTLLHGPIENGTFKVDLKGYRPKLLGTTVEEASWHLLHRVHEGIINARTTTFPIIAGLYANDPAAVVTSQMKAAAMDGRIVADALHTILCLGASKFDQEQQESLRVVSIADFWPIEAVNLYYPQSQFFSSPYWGHPRVGAVLQDGTKALPLKLRIQDQSGGTEKVFNEGIGAGVGRPLTWLLPKDIYYSFTVFAGLHFDLGAKGRVEFTILGDGQPLASAVVSGSEPAHAFECDLSGVTQLQLLVVTRGGEPRGNYAIWAGPTLLKKLTE